MIDEATKYFGLPDRLLPSIVQHESNGNVHAVSPVGAQGLTQLMPETAKGLGVTNSFDPQQNIAGGALYLRQMLDHFHGNLPAAIAAYNAGPSTVEAYLAGHGHLPAETIEYVKRVAGSMGLQ